MLLAGLTAISFLLLIIYCLVCPKRKGLPPGPTPLPIVGNLLSLRGGEFPADCFIRWGKQYGGLFTFWVGSRPCINVTDHAKMVEIFRKSGDCCGERSNYSGSLEVLSGGNYGLIYAKGDQWVEQRRFTINELRNFGMGRNIMEERILDEVTDLLKRLERETAPEVDVASHIDLSVGNIITEFLFKFRFSEVNVGEFIALKSATRQYLETIGCPTGSLAIIYPRTIGRLPHFRTLYNRFLNAGGAIYSFIDAQIEDHRRQFTNCEQIAGGTDASASANYVRAFLKESADREAAGEEQHSFTTRQLRAMCFDLWLAGQETTSTTIAWAIAYLLHHTAVRERMCKELSRVAEGRLIRMSDRNSLPYTRAVISVSCWASHISVDEYEETVKQGENPWAIQEVHRCANVLPNGIPRLTDRDAEIGGYHVPRGTPIVAQISAVLYDDRVFTEPTKFDSGRFFDANTDAYKCCEEFVPFSVGKRKCAGESLATMEIFLIIANLFNQYEFQPGRILPSLERTMGATVRCPPYTCRLSGR